MAGSSRKRTAAKRRKSGGKFFLVLMLLLVVAGVGWFWWQQKHPVKKAHHHRHPTAPIAAIPAPPPPAPVPTPISVAPPVVVSPPPADENTNQPVTNPPSPGQSTAGSPKNPEAFPRPVRDTLEVQVALARRAISPGSIDGANGSQTRAAVAAFQRTQNLPETGLLDTNTRAFLTLDAPILTVYTVTSNDLASLQPIGKTWLAKSQQSSLAYETELELVGEKAHSNPLLIKKLNPGIDWNNIAVGTALQIPDVVYPEPSDKADHVVIHLSQRYMEAFDQQSNLMAHFPCSIAAKVDKRPVGELHVTVIAPNPNYTVNPELFPESDELRALGHKLILPPGPNNPVGVAWIGLDRPGYGMHGTPIPEQVGRTESHGCFRLANWDATYLLSLSWVGMPVYVEP